MLLDEFLRGYIVCALWASTDEYGEPLDAVFSRNDLSPEAFATMREDCTDFLQANAADLRLYAERIRYDPSQGTPADYAGHDFWLTRNRHGAGFWDRGLGCLGERLRKAAQVYGSCDLYAGDNGRLYVG